MDDITRAMLEDAFALDDEARADYERHERKRAKLEKKSAASDLVFKTYQPRPTPQPQQSTAMDPAVAEQWNKWLSDFVERELKANNEAMVDPIAEFVVEYVRGRLDAETKKLRAEIAALRTEVAELRGDMALGVRAANGEIAGVIHRHVA